MKKRKRKESREKARKAEEQARKSRTDATSKTVAIGPPSLRTIPTYSTQTDSSTVQMCLNPKDQGKIRKVQIPINVVFA